MNVTTFAYDLPEELIAQYPCARRDRARLLVVDRKTGAFHHDVFARIGSYLPAGAHLVLNDSKVVAARLLGRREKTGGVVEIFLLRKLAADATYEVLLRPLRRLHNGDRVMFEGTDLVAEIVDREKRIVRFNRKHLSAVLERIGHMPLPPYIKRPDDARDKREYQTVFAKEEGSVAAPTAGLHFTRPLLAALKKEGHAIDTVTLHINYATFKPVEEEDITTHVMHHEEFAVAPETYVRLSAARKKGAPIVAVGTTSCRVLETVARTKALSGSTDIFMYPGFRFQMTDALITNFHLPLSTLLMLVYAFGGTERMRRAYQEAIREKYRFFSYGDAMLIV